MSKFKEGDMVKTSFTCPKTPNTEFIVKQNGNIIYVGDNLETGCSQPYCWHHVSPKERTIEDVQVVDDVEWVIKKLCSIQEDPRIVDEFVLGYKNAMKEFLQYLILKK